MNAYRQRDNLAEHHVPLGPQSAHAQRAPRLRAGTVVLLTLVLAAAAAISGYCGYTLWVKHRKLTAVQGELSELATAHEKAEGELDRLEGLRAEHERALEEGKGRIADLEAQLAAASEQLAELEADRAQTDARLAEFRRITQQFQKMVDSGRLEVVYRRGRMMVALPAQVLFPSGSDKLTEEGSKALREVAAILRGVPGRRFIVAGHTDNVPVSTPEFADNWQLSTARALRVTQALVAAGMRPSQLVAAGHAEFEPAATNKTARGRQKNRRIEIVLEPHLRPVPGLELDEPAEPVQGADQSARAAAAKGAAQPPAAQVPAGESSP